jgi:asparagine synthase (glutamine-hydrolysing)
MPLSESAQPYFVKGLIHSCTDPDWRALSGISSSVRPKDGDFLECTTPGLEISWSAKYAAHATRDGILCIVWGSPRCSVSQSTDVAGTASAELILDRLALAGISALRDIRGGYGLFFIDVSAQRLILAVDRFSIETVCFAIEDSRLAFSDRANVVPVRSRTVARQSLYDYLYFHCIPAPVTVFEEVRRLGHGSHLCVDRGQLASDYHWKPRFEPSRETPFKALCKQFRDLIRDAVAVEAKSGETLGCFLSGGTDSSTIAGMLCAVTGKKARTYSIGFAAPGYDEMEYARIAARHFGTDHHEYYVTANDLVSRIPEVAAFLDQPFGNSSVLPAYFCAQMAHADGVTRMLAGDGGDELFGGNARYRLQQVFDLYGKLPTALRESLIEPALAGSSLVRRIPGPKQVAGYVRHARIPMPDRMESFNLLSDIGSSRMLNPEFLAAIDTGAPLQAQRAAYARTRTGSIINRMLHYDWKFTLADSDLPKVRAAIGLTGMTVGYPLLADELADFSLHLPTEFKVRNFRLRWFFKQALRGFLPDAIIQKKKHGFGLPFGLWATQHSGLHDLAADSLAELERRDILRSGFRDELIGQLLPAHPGYYGELVWILMMLEQWLASRNEACRLPPSFPA